MSTPTTFKLSMNAQEHGADLDYFAIRIRFSNVNGPGRGSISAIQDIFWLWQRGKDQSFIEDDIEGSVLMLKSFNFFLGLVSLSTCGSFRFANFIYRDKVNVVVDRVFLKLAIVKNYGLTMLRLKGCCSLLSASVDTISLNRNSKGE